MPHSRPHLLLARLAVALVAATAAGCGKADSEALPPFPADSYMARIQQRGHLVVGVQPNDPPFAYPDPSTKQVEGFEADLGRELARALFADERRVEFVPATSYQRTRYLQIDRVDVVLSEFEITDLRRQIVDFSEPYYVAGQALLVRKGSPIRSVDDLAGRSVAGWPGTTSERTLRERVPSANLLLFRNWDQMLVWLEDDRLDAIIYDDTSLLSAVATNPDLQVVQPPFGEERYGAGVRQRRPEFVAFINQVFRAVKAGGRWTELYRKHITQLTGIVPDPPGL